MPGSDHRRASAIRFIVCLGVVSLFADMTYEGARSILGPFLLGLGASAAQVGVIAGGGEMVAAGLRYFSGRLADRTRAYWTITIAGYAINVIAVPMLAFAGNWQVAALLVVAERTGKALRGPARDVLLSAATGEVGHGWGFGLHSALDQAGAVLGPLMVAWGVARTHGFAPVFLWLAIPAALTMASLLSARLVFGGRDTAPAGNGPQELPGIFWRYTAAAALLAAGFADFALLAFHFQKGAVEPAAAIPLLYAGAMAANGIGALAFGRMFDRFGVDSLVVGIVLSACSLPLGFLGGKAGAIAGVICWGAGMGAQDATLRAGIARVVSMDRRGKGFGVFHGVFGVAWFAGSAVMGVLYERSVVALVVFGVTLQLAAAVWFRRLKGGVATNGLE